MAEDKSAPRKWRAASSRRTPKARPSEARPCRRLRRLCGVRRAHPALSLSKGADLRAKARRAALECGGLTPLWIPAERADGERPRQRKLLNGYQAPNSKNQAPDSRHHIDAVSPGAAGGVTSSFVILLKNPLSPKTRPHGRAHLPRRGKLFSPNPRIPDGMFWRLGGFSAESIIHSCGVSGGLAVR